FSVIMSNLACMAVGDHLAESEAVRVESAHRHFDLKRMLPVRGAVIHGVKLRSSDRHTTRRSSIYANDELGRRSRACYEMDLGGVEPQCYGAVVRDQRRAFGRSRPRAAQREFDAAQRAGDFVHLGSGCWLLIGRLVTFV